MNYFELHLGDYACDTENLSALQHGIYLLLMRRYYKNEAPIPDALAASWAKSPRAEVEPILFEFFTRDGGVWRHKRIDEEIAKYQAKITSASTAGKASASARAATSVQRDGNDRSTTVERPLNDRSTHQTPDTRHQTPQSQEQSARDRALTAQLSFDRFWTAYPRKTAKAAAQKAWRKAEPHIGAILLDLAARAAEGSWADPQFIPHPATYLRGERWRDARPQAARAPPQRLSKTAAAYHAIGEACDALNATTLVPNGNRSGPALPAPAGPGRTAGD